MKKALAQGLLLLLVTAFTAGCIAPVSLKDSWRDPRASAKVYQKLMVVAVAHNREQRELLENISVTMLDEHGVAAIQSHRLIGDIKQADASVLQTLARSVGADAVVITHAISKSEHEGYRYVDGILQAGTPGGAEQGEASPDVLAMSVVGVTPREADFVQGYLQARLFDVDSARLVWLSHSSVLGDGNRGNTCWDYAILLTKSLARDGLIAINAREFKKPML